LGFLQRAVPPSAYTFLVLGGVAGACAAFAPVPNGRFFRRDLLRTGNRLAFVGYTTKALATFTAVRCGLRLRESRHGCVDNGVEPSAPEHSAAADALVHG